MTWRDLLRDDLRQVRPYRANLAPASIRLDANESPFELPEPIRAECQSIIAQAPLHRYPDIAANELRQVLSDQFGVAPDQIVLGNGSDELIGLLASTFGKPPKNQSRARVCYPTPTFVMYRLGTLGSGAAPLEVPLRPSFELDDMALERAIVGGQPNLLFLARPNNPTGTLWPRELLSKLAKTHPRLLLVIDEAYSAFAGEHCLALIAEHENVVILRTLSKIGLASLRIGILIARPEIAAEVEKVRSPYNLGGLNQRLAAFLMQKHHDWFTERAQEIMVERDRLTAALSTHEAMTVFPSRANFILVRVPDPGKVFQALLSRGIRIKNFDGVNPLLAGCLRITIGTRAENDALLGAWPAIVPNPSVPVNDSDAAPA